jgi:MoaA/NifB/PqqE/SkfB family radical SAM enzyme
MVEKRLECRKILRFSVHLTDHCNLNCKGCDNFSPIADKKYLDIRIFEQDCRRISELTKRKIEAIHLMGGEPLLHPQNIDILDIAGEFFETSKRQIKIITNGILLLKQSDKFWKTCKKNNIEIYISVYPIYLNRDKINKLGNKYGINIKYLENPNLGSKIMHRLPLDINGNQNQNDSFLLCYRANSCILLEEGKIYTCATIPFIKYFNNYFNKQLLITENDYIDIYKIETVDEIFKFLCKPMPFCRYCNIKDSVYGVEWSISKKDISEWI